MRIGVIGAGRIGALHARVLAAQPTTAHVLVHDADPARAAHVADAIGGTPAATIDELLAGVDAVVIASSTDAHAMHVARAIEAGRPAFVEKPLAFELDETEALVAQAAATGAIVQVGFQRRFDPAYVAARELVASGALGTVYLVRLIAADHEPPPDAYIPQSGGLFRDSSIHDFDILRWVTGREIVEVYATGSVREFPVFAASNDVDTAGAVITLDNGTIAVLGQTRHDPRGYDVRMEVVGSRDAIAVGLDAGTPIHAVGPGAANPAGPPWLSFLDRFEAAYRAELLAFVDVVRGTMPNPCGPLDALQAMRASAAASRSLREHRPVRLEEFG